jgi:hypothetical protein
MFSGLSDSSPLRQASSPSNVFVPEHKELFGSLNVIDEKFVSSVADFTPSTVVWESV